MTNDEYQGFLKAVAEEYVSRHLQTSLRYPDEHELGYVLERLSAAGALAAALGRMRDPNDKLVGGLCSELHELPWGAVERAFEEFGVLNALEDHGTTLIGEFRLSAMPEDDWRILGDAGLENPESAMRLSEETGKRRMRHYEGQRAKPHKVLDQARIAVRDAHCPGQDAPEERDNAGVRRSRRKWFKGITRIVAGGAGAVGNVALGVGALPAATPVGAAAVLSSCTGALVLIGDGVEALSAER